MTYVRGVLEDKGSTINSLDCMAGVGKQNKTKVNLAKRGISVENSLCSMCGEEEETTSHIFCACMVAWLVWAKCYEWVG